MKAALALILAAALGAAGARALPLERDLGQGLTYLRVHALPDDLAAPAATGRCYVLDLRYVHGGAIEGAGLLAWLRQHAGPRTPVFLLANDHTAAALLAPLNSPEAVTGLVILGSSARGFEPDIALSVAAAAERRAYGALENGATIDSLIVEKNDKVRNDEAALAQPRAPDPSPDDAPKEEEPKAKASAPQIIDPVLRRAVQLHRSLLALKRV